MSESKGVLVYCEINNNKFTSQVSELLGCGKILANELGQELGAVIIGSKVSHLADEAIAFGADTVFIADEPFLEEYQIDSYLHTLINLIHQMNPQILLLEHSSIGRDLAPTLAFRLKTAASLDCIRLAIDPESKRLLQTKPVYGGNAQAIYICPTDPQIVTVRNKSMPKSEKEASRKGKIIPFKVEVNASIIRSKVLKKLPSTVEGIKLEEAEVIVAGGRGIGSAEGFKQLAELAKLLKGAVGATRPVCDNDWLPETHQIGLTGKIVAPRLYFAIAISGASQHLSGCMGAKNIVAINRDPEATIFSVAKYGIIGDWKQLLPAFTNKIKEMSDGT